MPFEAYLKKGLLKRQRVNFKQIEKQIVRAKKDLDTAQMLLAKDPEWAATIAYHAMLRAGRALLFSSGYLPADGGQHRTVVELTHRHLGRDYASLVEHFEKMRRKRNIFFYESDPFGTLTEAENALKAASQLIRVIQGMIREENPQVHFCFD
ncbi:MAG: HEPN domain-containing protein [Candidatus Omnitrophica bacterium]|nr:HEPN domain-containing protein [Candidatus Omnitrophota bacterium]